MDARDQQGGFTRGRRFFVAGAAGLLVILAVLTLFVLRARGPAGQRAEDCEDPTPPATQFEVAGCEAGEASPAGATVKP